MSWAIGWWILMSGISALGRMESVSFTIVVGLMVALSSNFLFFFSSRRRHTRCSRDWSSDVCSSDLICLAPVAPDCLAWLGGCGNDAYAPTPGPFPDPVLTVEPCGDDRYTNSAGGANPRSEERRVGKECRSRRSACH